jgi:hypothetical protein
MLFIYLFLIFIYTFAYYFILNAEFIKINPRINDIQYLICVYMITINMLYLLAL